MRKVKSDRVVIQSDRYMKGPWRWVIRVGASYVASTHPDNSMLVIELIFVHFRKALEEIAFAPFAANREKYAATRTGFATDWNARRMRGFIEKVNRISIRCRYWNRKRLHLGKDFERMNEPFLTREDFEKLYDSQERSCTLPLRPARLSSSDKVLHRCRRCFLFRLAELVMLLAQPSGCLIWMRDGNPPSPP
jgi:hypothetical protein